MISNEERERGMRGMPEGNSIQRRADFLIECLREATDAELRTFFTDLGDWIIADERVLSMFNANLLDLYFAEMDQRR